MALSLHAVFEGLSLGLVGGMNEIMQVKLFENRHFNALYCLFYFATVKNSIYYGFCSFKLSIKSADCVFQIKNSIKTWIIYWSARGIQWCLNCIYADLFRITPAQNSYWLFTWSSPCAECFKFYSGIHMVYCLCCTDYCWGFWWHRYSRFR